MVIDMCFYNHRDGLLGPKPETVKPHQYVCSLYLGEPDPAGD